MNTGNIKLQRLLDLLEEETMQAPTGGQTTIIRIPKSTLWIVYLSKESFAQDPWFVRAWSRRGTVQVLGFVEIVTELIANEMEYSEVQPLIGIRFPDGEFEIELCTFRAGTAMQHNFTVESYPAIRALK